jgi:hypothetical protein
MNGPNDEKFLRIEKCCEIGARDYIPTEGMINLLRRIQGA